MIVGLLFTPTLVAKWGGMYRLNLTGYTIGTLGRLGVVVAGYLGSVPLMLACTAIAAIGMSRTAPCTPAHLSERSSAAESVRRWQAGSWLSPAM